jgi:probable HAF family extracellular repeat protein
MGLGDLPGGTEFSEAYDVSADGSVVVGWASSALGFEAIRWTASGGMMALGDLPGAEFTSRAFSVSADGSVVVGEGFSVGGHEAFRWTAEEGMVGLGDLPGGGGLGSAAFGVSADGSVVVGRGNSNGGVEAIRWTASDGVISLGDLPGGDFYSSASGVSADGSIVVGGSKSSSSGVFGEAFRMSAPGTLQSLYALGDLPGGAFASGAFDVTADGSVVVGVGTSASGGEAFRWTAEEGMVGLGDFAWGELR